MTRSILSHWGLLLLAPALAGGLCSYTGKPCVEAIRDGDVYHIRIIERNTAEGTGWTPEASCGEDFDFSPGGEFVVRAVDLSDLGHRCRIWTAELVEIDGLEVQGTTDAFSDRSPEVFHISHEVSSTRRPGCGGDWFAGINGAKLFKYTDGGDRGRGIVGRRFEPADPSACGLTRSTCFDQYIVEIHPEDEQ